MNHKGYYFNPKAAGFIAGSATFCLDNYQAELFAPAKMQGSELMLSANDGIRLAAMLPTPIALPDSEGWIAFSVIATALGCKAVQQGSAAELLLTDDAEPLPEDEVKQALSQKKGQPGDYFGAYWNEALQRFSPYRIYLPASYDPKGKNKLIMGLHGGGGNPNNIFKNSNDKIKEYAERDGYALIAPDGSTYNSTYGCAIPPNGMLGAVAEVSDPQNPENLSPEDMRSVAMGEIGLTLALELAQHDYAIDKSQMYLMGNSMGGMGTLYYASRHPGVFRKISPQGAIPNMKFFDDSGLKNQPTFFVAGE